MPERCLERSRARYHLGVLTLNGRQHHNAVHVLDGMPQTIAHGAEEGAGKIAEAIGGAGARVAKGAGQVHAGRVRRTIAKRRARMLARSDAMLKAQMVKTSRELAHESSDLNAAVDSLNHVISKNRRAAARGRSRLIGGLALGAALMYHLDAEHGRERRAATARLLTSMWRGRREPMARAV